jgi:DNA-directed RNA polymerase sigma subunit (sigma70/sigma32)
MTDNDLIKKVKEEQDSSALNELVSRHTGLYVKIVNTYSYVPPIERQDILNDKTYNIYQYALDYDPNRNMKFSVYIGQRLKWDCIGAISDKIDTEEISSEIEDKTIDSSKNGGVLDFIVENTSEITDKRFFDIFKYRHLMDKPLSWKKIGEEVGMTYEGARKIYLHNIEFLKNRIKREKLV